MGIKDHPFAVEAFFERSLVLTYAVPLSQLQKLVPATLELDTLNDEFGFVAAALVQTKRLRPKGFPKFLGNDFFLIGYRVFVRYTNTAGKRLRGLYILGSQTDSKRMELAGNFFTRYNYSTTQITSEYNDQYEIISSESSGFRVKIDLTVTDIPLPNGSPFIDWKEARRFAGPLPFTFTVNEEQQEILIIEGVRSNWQPKPTKVLDHHFQFIQDLNLQDVTLANAFAVRNIPYWWKRGKKETLSK